MMKRFQLEKNGTTAAAEAMAGITSFLAVSYILVVNPVILGQTGMPPAAIYTATALTAGASTIFLALFANLPFTMAPAMSLNVFFANALCLSLGFAWQEALCLGFLSGAAHAALMLGPHRRKLVRHCIPDYLKYATFAGIGACIAAGGFRYSGLLSASGGKNETVAFGALEQADPLPPIIEKLSGSHLVTILGILITVGLLALERKNKASYAAFPIGVLLATFVGIPLGVTALPSLFDFDTGALLEIRRTCFAFLGNPGLVSILQTPAKMAAAAAVALGMAFMTVTDSAANVFGLGTLGCNRLFTREELDGFNGAAAGGTNRIDKALVANSFGGMTGAVFGCSPSIIYVESSLGVAAMGRTGMTALVSGILFLASIPLVTLFHVLPAEAVGAALILCGVFPVSQARKIDWDDFGQAVPAGLTLLVIVATNDFIGGLSLGIACHIVYQAAAGRGRALHPLLAATGALLAGATLLLHLIRS